MTLDKTAGPLVQIKEVALTGLATVLCFPTLQSQKQKKRLLLFKNVLEAVKKYWCLTSRPLGTFSVIKREVFSVSLA